MKLLRKIFLVLVAFAFGTGYSFLPVLASAEEMGTDESYEISSAVDNENTVPDTNVETSETDAGTSSEVPTEEGAEDENSSNEDVSEDDNDVETEPMPEDTTSDAEYIPESGGSKWFDEYIMPLLVGLFAPLGGTIVGGVSLGCVLFKGVKAFKELLQTALSGLKKAKEQTDTAETDLIDAKEKMAGWQTEQESALSAWESNLKEELKSFVANLQDWQTAQVEQAAARGAAQIREIQSFEAKQNAATSAWRATQIDAMKQLEEKLEKQLEAMFNQLKEVMADKVADTNKTVHKLLDVEKIAYGDNPVLVSNGTAKKIAEVTNK